MCNVFFWVILDNPSAVNRKSKYSEQPSRLKLKLIFLPQPAHIAIGFDVNLQWNSRPNRLRFIYDKMLKSYSVSESLTMKYVHPLSDLTSLHSSTVKLTISITDLHAMKFDVHGLAENSVGYSHHLTSRSDILTCVCLSIRQCGDSSCLQAVCGTALWHSLCWWRQNWRADSDTRTVCLGYNFKLGT
jgi:hypothetical protein